MTVTMEESSHYGNLSGDSTFTEHSYHAAMQHFEVLKQEAITQESNLDYIRRVRVHASQTLDVLDRMPFGDDRDKVLVVLANLPNFIYRSWLLALRYSDEEAVARL